VYKIYTSDIPHNDTTILGTFADDKGIIACDPKSDPITFKTIFKNYKIRLLSGK